MRSGSGILLAEKRTSATSRNRTCFHSRGNDGVRRVRESVNPFTVIRDKRAIVRGARTGRKPVNVDRVASHQCDGEQGEDDKREAKIDDLETRHGCGLSGCVCWFRVIIPCAGKKEVQRKEKVWLLVSILLMGVEEEAASISAGELPFHIR
jgi:hypothetical protein